MRIFTKVVVASATVALIACDGTESPSGPPQAGPAGIAAVSVGNGIATGEDVFDFRSLTGNVLTGATGALRGLSAGGLPWVLDGARARLTRDGRLRVDIRGLVLAAGPSAGTNPIPQFRAVVSCVAENGSGYDTVNVASDPVPATSTGDATVDQQLTGLPARCLTPAVFVTSPGLSWFAVTE
jgi:hypothetical protein